MANAISERDGETTRLGSFEIIRRLARGGMAEIYLARSTAPAGSPTLVVLKKILPKYAGKPWFVQLFLDEANLAASLHHPHIAQVYEIGSADGSSFFTMEYLHGQDVRSILHRTWRIGERFPIDHAVQIGRHVASALHFAHEQQGPDGAPLGIVHRDVSPSNVIVTYDGATKLLDFGVAKTAARTVKTRTGALKGKISYMSPEQARGAPIDRRSDVFSLGIVLWEMVTTQRLYRGGNDLATLQLIITQLPRPPSSVRPDVPPELERIVLRALAQNPDERYATADELVRDLDELARTHGLDQSPGALSATVSELFGPELGAWREAQAAGVPLADHLHDAGDMTTPISESDFIELDLGADDDDDDELDELIDEDPSGQSPAAPASPQPARAATQSGPAQRIARAPSGAVAREPSGAVARAPSSGVAREPTGAVVRAPSSAVAREPSGAVARAPSGAVARAPSSGVAREPSGAVARGSSPGAPRAGSPVQIVVPFATLAAALDLPATSIHDEPTRAVDQSAHVDDERGSADGDDELTLHAATVIDVGELTADEPLPADPMLPTDPATARLPVEPSAGLASGYERPTAPYASASDDPPISSLPFAPPPWHAGTAAPPSPTPVPAPSDRIHRSWAIVDLPAFDPETFARHRRIVLRVTGGLIGFILLLAIIAGRC